MPTALRDIAQVLVCAIKVGQLQVANPTALRELKKGDAQASILKAGGRMPLVPPEPPVARTGADAK